VGFTWSESGDISEKNSSEYKFLGTHFLASYSECDEEAIQNVARLEKVMLEAAKEARATVLDSSFYIFPGNGFTMVILLSESHATIHTYPEHKACFIDFFTCGNKCSSEKFNQFLQSYLKPKKVVFRTFVRDEEIVEKKG
jgi:S-adenosylmethionine decarboxylase proenzyme